MLFERATGFSLSQGIVSFKFSSELDAQVVSLHKDKVTEWVDSLLGPKTPWQTGVLEEVVEQPKPEEKKNDAFVKQVQLFKTIFRAEVLPPKEGKT